MFKLIGDMLGRYVEPSKQRQIQIAKLRTHICNVTNSTITTKKDDFDDDYVIVLDDDIVNAFKRWRLYSKINNILYNFNLIKKTNYFHQWYKYNQEYYKYYGIYYLILIKKLLNNWKTSFDTINLNEMEQALQANYNNDSMFDSMFDSKMCNF